MTKVTLLARLTVQGEQAQLAVMKLIELCGLMASMLSAEARVAVAAQLRDEADMLCPPLDRRALH
jgi:hypothetical protein